MSEVDPAERHDPPANRDVTVEWAGGEAHAGVGELTGWVGALLGEVAPDATSLAVRLVDEDEMRRLNRTFRRIDKPTDVLSFPGEGNPEQRHLGDIAVAVPVARRQAEERGHSLETEIKLLVLHGVLHCAGYDHETDDGEMEAAESELRACWIPGAG